MCCSFGVKVAVFFGRVGGVVRYCVIAGFAGLRLVLCFLRLSMSVVVPQVRFLGRVLCPSLLRLVPVAGRRAAVWFPQVQFLDKVVQFSYRGAEADSMVFCSEGHKCSPVAPRHGGRCPCCAGLAGSLVSGSLLYGVRCSLVEYQTTDFLGSLLQECFTCSALPGSTVGTCSASVYGAFWTGFTRVLRGSGLRIGSTMWIG